MSLSAHGLAFGYPRRRVGSIAEATFARGEVTCILGPNGGGKTTLLRTMLGLLPALSGEVRLEGRPLASYSPRERSRRMAYVPQAAESYFDFSVAEMVEMGRASRGNVFSVPVPADRAAALAALERLGIGALASRPIRRVSGGERQLVLIARALAGEAGVLVMDEPTATLDFGNQARVLHEIARLRAAGMAIAFTTHHPDHALAIADHVLLVKEGTLLAAGPAGATLNSSNLSALYGCTVDVVDVPSSPGVTARACIARTPGQFG
jgi:iron complex transport system ATP-binding protein